MFKITIPKPCHEDWSQMTTVEQGRHCKFCSKTVTDFTSMNDEEVQRFFIDSAGEKTCGRFLNTQLKRVRVNIPEEIFHISMPIWKRFLVASLLVFGATLFSCDTSIEKKNTNEPMGITISPVIKGTTSISKANDTSIAVNTTTFSTTVGLIPPLIIDSNRIETGEIALMPDSAMNIPHQPQPTISGDIELIKISIDSTDCNLKKYY